MSKRKGTYRTAKGRKIDMDAIIASRGDTVALGNLGVNARGDKLGKGGEVVQRANERIQEYNESNPNAVRKAVSVKGDALDDPNGLELEEAKPAETTKPKGKTRAKPAAKKATAKAKTVEKELPDGSIEIVEDDGEE